MSAAQAVGLVRFAEGKKHQARGRPCVFRSVPGPHRTGEHACGPLDHEMPQPQDLAAPHALIALTAGAYCPAGKPHQPAVRRYGTMVNKVG